MDALRIGPRLTIPGEALSWTASRAEGPGGQHVNKTSTRVELRCDVALSTIPEPVLRRMYLAAPRWFDSAGNLLVISQKTRSQSRNLADATERLVEWVRQCLTPPKRRRPTKPSRGSVRRRLDGKKKAGDKKKSRAWRPGND
ncbi:MAG: aminoacyl-tRNA hydrolase [Myxococcales bacterium]|nr:aminoacyl-tRNA hydrolase [Myxococcales bacterium]